MSIAPPVAKKVNLSSEKQISDLADADLATVFEFLPPYDRLLVSEVCHRWNELSRKAWLGVTELDLSHIPGKHIGAVVNQCPNVQTVFALKKSFDLNDFAVLSQSKSLSTVKFYDSEFAVKSGPDLSVINDGFAQMFSENLQQASWHELILHDARIYDKSVASGDISVSGPVSFYQTAPSIARPKWAFTAAYLPASLTRLQLSGFSFGKGSEQCDTLFLDSIGRLQNLECCIFHRTPCGWIDHYHNETHDLVDSALLCDVFYEKLGALKSLRELSVSPAWYLTFTEANFARLIASLPQLEVLFLFGVCGYAIEEYLKTLITDNSVLRILLLSGEFTRRPRSMDSDSRHRRGNPPPPVRIPPRMRFPNGFSSDPLPLLHVFVGKEASERLHFEKSSSDAALIHTIDMPMIQFFEREDVKPIFDGVWAAEKIKDTAKYGSTI